MNAMMEAPDTAQTQAVRKPCCLAVSAVPDLSRLDATGDVRTWKALSLDRRSVLGTGEVRLDGMEPLAVVRDRAAAAARECGFDPTQFILEQPAAR